MLFSLFLNNAGGSGWEMALQNGPSFYGNESFMTLVFGMKMSRWVVGMVHANVNTKKV